MARFYARFDSGSAGWESGFASGLVGSFFDQLRIAANSASAAPLRDGLIASRSAVSTDVYDDLDAANKDGSKGTYFPPDIPTLPTSTLISWSTAYSSSVDGIKTPTTNTYGTGQVNYSLRPTGSITSSQTTLVAPTNPLDPVQLNYNVYLSASNAVQAVLRAAQTGSGGEISPYTRTGNTSSRTLHSIWHDPNLQYFAWDDFTPGIPVLPTAPTEASNLPCTGTAGSYVYTPTLNFYYNGTYKNDLNPNDGKIRIQVNFTYAGIGAGAGSTGTPIDDTIVVTGSATYGNGYQYNRPVTLYAGNDNAVNLIARVTMSYYDALIPSSRGPLVYNDALGINLFCPNGLP